MVEEGGPEEKIRIKPCAGLAKHDLEKKNPARGSFSCTGGWSSPPCVYAHTCTHIILYMVGTELGGLCADPLPSVLLLSYPSALSPIPQPLGLTHSGAAVD